MWWMALQPVLLAAVLGWAGAVKLSGRQAAAVARRTALRTLLGEWRAVLAYRAVGFAEMSVAVVLFGAGPRWLGAAGAVALTGGFLAYLGYARAAAPQSSCGCLGRRRTPVAWRSFVRGGLLLAAALAALASPVAWRDAVRSRPAVAVTVLLAEVALVVVFSPELDHTWLVPLRQARVRLTHPLASDPGTVPLLASVQQVQLSPAYQRVAPLLRSDVREYWDDGDWRFLAHAARYENRPVTAVFAVEREHPDPDAVRVAIVDEQSGETLLRFEPELVG